MKLNEEIITFLKSKDVVLVSTLDEKGRIHCAVKGIVEVLKSGKIFIIDLFSGQTLKNIRKNPNVSIAATDEVRFKGYTLQGKAIIVPKWQIHQDFINKWETHVIQKVSDRISRSVHSGKKGMQHYELSLPDNPKHIIDIQVENIIDLSPRVKKK